jgi:hypothetical protein
MISSAGVMVSNGSIRHIITLPKQDPRRAGRTFVKLEPVALKLRLEEYHLTLQEPYVYGGTRLVPHAYGVLPPKQNRDEIIDSKSRTNILKIVSDFPTP